MLTRSTLFLTCSLLFFPFLQSPLFGCSCYHLLCQTNADCPSSQACQKSGRCEPQGESGLCKAPSQMLCNATCVDLRTNNQNCGACGKTCSVGSVCDASQCTPAKPACNETCSAGSKCQNGQCIVPKVDILFLISNAGSNEEQSKLYPHTNTFLQALSEQSIKDFQIAVATTDMDKTFNPNGWGRFVQAAPNTPKIISSQQSPAQMADAFAKNIRVGLQGSSFTRPLEAIHALFSPSKFGGFADTNNKGFLRTGATLAIFFFTDKDDCSHNDKLDERQPPETCSIPPSVSVTDKQGNPIIGPDGQPIKGQMDKLNHFSLSIDFMKSLQRDFITFGVIGAPSVFRPGTTTLIDPEGGCTQDIQCGSHGMCTYFTPTPVTKKCGGCKQNDSDAQAAFRLFEFISQTNPGDPNEYWSSICGNDESMRQAVRQFAKKIAQKLGI